MNSLHEVFDHLVQPRWSPSSSNMGPGLRGEMAIQHNEEQRRRYNEELEDGVQPGAMFSEGGEDERCWVFVQRQLI